MRQITLLWLQEKHPHLSHFFFFAWNRKQMGILPQQYFKIIIIKKIITCDQNNISNIFFQISSLKRIATLIAIVTVVLYPLCDSSLNIREEIPVCILCKQIYMHIKQYIHYCICIIVGGEQKKKKKLYSWLFRAFTLPYGFVIKMFKWHLLRR